MAKHDKIAQITPRIREGEGVVVTTTRRMVPQPDGTTSYEMAVDMGDAPVPERRYVADIASVSYRDGTVYLVFGQRKLVGRGLRTMVVLTMSSSGVLNFLKACEGIPSEVLNKFVSPNLMLKPDELEEEPSQVVDLAANIIVAGFSGREACFDFYFVSPYVLGQLAQGGKFAVDPVVRVILQSGLASAIVKSLQAFKEQFPNDEIEQVWRSGKSPEGSHA
jgi:hypothetical protein